MKRTTTYKNINSNELEVYLSNENSGYPIGKVTKNKNIWSVKAFFVYPHDWDYMIRDKFFSSIEAGRKLVNLWDKVQLFEENYYEDTENMFYNID